MVRTLLVVSFSVALAGCCCPLGSWQQSQPSSSTYTPPSVPAATTPTPTDPNAPVPPPGPPPSAPGAAAAGGVCMRAARCCRAYMETMGTPANASICSNYENMPIAGESGCQSAITGWRTGLNALRRAVPADCN